MLLPLLLGTAQGGEGAGGEGEGGSMGDEDPSLTEEDESDDGSEPHSELVAGARLVCGWLAVHTTVPQQRGACVVRRLPVCSLTS
jgi:hypothetical protein